MRKLFFIFLFSIAQMSYAAELRPHFRVWKSSYLGTGAFTNVQISSSTILFNVVYGSPTVNIGGASYFALHQSTGDVFTSDSSTKAFCSLDSATENIGDEYKVSVTSHAYFTKQGGANIGYLWDWATERPDYLRTSDPSPDSLRIMRD